MKKRYLGFLAILAAGVGPAVTAADASVQPAAVITFNKDKVPLSTLACASNPTGSAVRLKIAGLKHRTGTLRVQLYNAAEGEFLEKGRWLVRMQGVVPASGEVEVCMPLQHVGASYGVFVRHDANANGKTDMSDGGGASRNPRLKIFSKPRPAEAGFVARAGVQDMTIVMNYMSGLSLKPVKPQEEPD